jgi:PAP2 superfamily
MEVAMLSSRLINAATLLVVFGTAPIAKADIATDWNRIAVEATAVPPNSILQSRVLAITHAAMYDAARLINQKPALFVTGIQPDGPSSLEAAVAAAGHTVLRRLTPPAQSAAVDAAYKSALSSVAEGSPKTNGVKLGEMVAEKLLEMRDADGSTQKADIKLKDGPGYYQLTPPHSMPPILPQWGGVHPFVIRLADGYNTKGPPHFDSAQFKADFDEVKLLGARHSSVRTADQTAAAIFWTVQTGVPWFAAARAAAAERSVDVLDNLHLFALLSVAVADSQIACFKDKYDRLHWRPITAIRAAAALKIATLVGDSAWEPLLGTPPHPEYPSAHACFSGAAEAVLRGELKTDLVKVSVTFPPMFGVTRTFNSFSAISKEVNDARVWGGIHFRSADIDGHELGWRVGEAVLRDFGATPRSH